MLRIIGIDPGSRQTGYGLIDSDGMHSLHLAHGVLRLNAKPLPPRLGEIFKGISALIREYQPEVMAIEEVFVAKNPSSALKLGQARGAAICAAEHCGLSVVEYTPTRIKQAVVGTGRADKAQIQHMVKMILGLRERPQADAADALAVALSHAHTHTTLIRQASQGKRGT
ncbi:MAG: crossover junction endodeoxyribonuclease RuvC [gamma proteobacterium symbiont of Ctena orbiculata]|nr:crossover junction endodeoxyribonuclease RuvC [Candidatus Thiodiazotropha taylori]MBT3058674.1 crossover junction endodeoxyribonuclease RuvC [Candidatus Thiodiazotropha sp. (ex Lucina pensylvanica)]MBV2094804.1 crossover junction endodeoxyribonuclease RuvC [Candidatus Thiodiazotropha sp. (ex Codakia orbicularis)]PUB73396.1 MAG: crossover junction endodeoxyribonuclease RuvC [gamma proteobacterium symbiont of Ctena orbiculata]MBT3064369.1 crossover junction endodeoxyribonuclease RuvC [Candidat